MSSESRSEQGGTGAETNAPNVATTSEALERQLTEALAADDASQTRFHIRQALQLVEALEE